MLPCHKNDQSKEAKDDNSVGTEESQSGDKHANARKGWMMAAGGAAAAIFGPHALCVLGLAGASGLGAWGLTSWCGHGESSADSSHGVELRRVEKMPAEFEKFSEVSNTRAKDVLFDIEPRFQEIFDAKQKEAGADPIKVVFLEVNGDKSTGPEVDVVLCKKGEFCPCSKPQIYSIGSKLDIAEPEKYRGQHQILKALYGGGQETVE